MRLDLAGAGRPHSAVPPLVQGTTKDDSVQPPPILDPMHYPYVMIKCMSLETRPYVTIRVSFTPESTAGQIEREYFTEGTPAVELVQLSTYPAPRRIITSRSYSSWFLSTSSQSS